MEDQPAGNYEALFVAVKGTKKKEEFNIEKVAEYEYEVLGGNDHYSGRVARIYIGLSDEEALWLGAMHNNTGSFRRKLTYRDQVNLHLTKNTQYI